MIRIARTFSIALAAAVAVAMFAAPARADVTVAVNGSQVSFDQPPLERGGRVFVPLRGVFERLGASVVYDNGLINASGNGRNISLHIGSTNATVNGQSQMLDVAPFVVGSRTLVPLRFVAQALGASVEWDQNSQTVRITGANGNNGNNGNNGGSGYATPSSQAVQVLNAFPTLVARRSVPNVSARFSVPVEPSSVHVRIDGVDMTQYTAVTYDGFNTTLQQRLSEGSHNVRVFGRTQSGERFSTGWVFRTVGF